MNALDTLIPTPRLLELDGVDLAMSPRQAWDLLRHGDIGAYSSLVRGLFSLRTLPSRVLGQATEPVSLRIDDLVSSKEAPGFQALYEAAPSELVVGAIGKVWRLDIPFVHVDGGDAFAAFNEPGFVKVAWAIRIAAVGEADAHVDIEVRVDATDSDSWKKFKRYFKLVGPGSRFIRHSFLSNLARRFGTPDSKERERPLPGDELLPDAQAQITQGITILSSPAQIWPWLVQMGRGSGGFYSIDVLDNGGAPSAREIHPELQGLDVGDVIPASAKGSDGFEVLRIEPERALVLGGLYDPTAKIQLKFDGARPNPFWQVTWAFVLERLDTESTRLHVRARAAFPNDASFHASWIRPVHHLMETAQLRHLAARAEGRLAVDDWRDVLEGLGGAAVMTAALLTPFLRKGRSHWGLSPAVAERPHPSDELVSHPRWSWTHGIEIDVPAEQVWQWVGQIGAGRAGFYSYQWLENIAGCKLRNAESVHPEWMVKEGGDLALHPKIPPLTVVSVVPGSYFVAYGRSDPSTASEQPVETSWLFWVEPLPNRRCRFISRYRCDCAEDLATTLATGPAFIEPIGFAMDRRMLLGVKERAERAAHRRAFPRSEAPLAAQILGHSK